MPVTLLPDHVDTLLESVRYSIERIRSTDGTPQDVRNESLARLKSAEDQLRAIRSEIDAAG